MYFSFMVYGEIHESGKELMSVVRILLLVEARCVWFAGVSSQGKGFNLQMAQAGFSSYLVQVSGSY